ncbi:uncharacterized protein LOC141899162 [Tubulanus polymorphus]|uniref:uncharacterized protein LOC141899162 n=1 Tax=Tubulanus polymorphus TaxID=672921 RepID=UPI003DA447A9
MYGLVRSVGYSHPDCLQLHIEKMIARMRTTFNQCYDLSHIPLILEVLDFVVEYPAIITPIYSDLMNWLIRIPPSEAATVWQKISEIVYIKKVPCEYSCLKSLWMNHRQSMEMELLKNIKANIEQSRYISVFEMKSALIHENIVQAAASSAHILSMLILMLHDLYQRTGRDLRLIHFSTALFRCIQQSTRTSHELSSYPVNLIPLLNTLSTASITGYSIPSSLLSIQVCSLWNILMNTRSKENCSQIWWLTCSYPEYQLIAARCLLENLSEPQTTSFTQSIDILLWFRYQSINHGAVNEEIVKFLREFKPSTMNKMNEVDIKNTFHKTSSISEGARPVLCLIVVLFVIYFENLQHFNTILQLVSGSCDFYSHIQIIFDIMDLLMMIESGIYELKMKPRIVSILSSILQQICSEIDNSRDEYRSSLEN